jgi:hypothetical protein
VTAHHLPVDYVWMPATFVLLHSPLVGPLTWRPVADELRRRDYSVVVPNLLGVARGPAPYWKAVRDQVVAALGEDEANLVLIAHSNAGLFVPVVVAALRGRVRSAVFVEAKLPAARGQTPVTSAERLAFLQSIARDGLLPRWTDWFDEADVAALFPDPETRARVQAEQPRMPLRYYDEQVPAPAGWDRFPCSYLWFGPPYDELAAEAEDRGWPVRQLPGQHLHAVVDPVGVSDEILALSSL